MRKFSIFLISGLLTSKAFCAPMLEAKRGYFFFSEHKMRKVYNRGGEDVQLALTVPLWNNSTSIWPVSSLKDVEDL